MMQDVILLVVFGWKELYQKKKSKKNLVLAYRICLNTTSRQTMLTHILGTLIILL